MGGGLGQINQKEPVQYTNEELLAAQKWFTSFQEMLREKGISYDNPVSLGLVHIVEDFGPEEVQQKKQYEMENSVEGIVEYIKMSQNVLTMLFMPEDYERLYQGDDYAGYLYDHMQNPAEFSNEKIVETYRLAQAGRIILDNTEDDVHKEIYYDHALVGTDGNVKVTNGYKLKAHIRANYLTLKHNEQYKEIHGFNDNDILSTGVGYTEEERINTPLTDEEIERVKEAGYTEDEYKMLEYQWFNLGYLMDYQRMMNQLEPIAKEGYIEGINEKEDYESIKKRLIENRQKEKENAQENVENTAKNIEKKELTEEEKTANQEKAKKALDQCKWASAARVIKNHALKEPEKFKNAEYRKEVSRMAGEAAKKNKHSPISKLRISNYKGHHNKEAANQLTYIYGQMAACNDGSKDYTDILEQVAKMQQNLVQKDQAFEEGAYQEVLNGLTLVEGMKRKYRKMLVPVDGGENLTPEQAKQLFSFRLLEDFGAKIDQIIVADSNNQPHDAIKLDDPTDRRIMQETWKTLQAMQNSDKPEDVKKSREALGGYLKKWADNYREIKANAEKEVRSNLSVETYLNKLAEKAFKDASPDKVNRLIQSGCITGVGDPYRKINDPQEAISRMASDLRDKKEVFVLIDKKSEKQFEAVRLSLNEKGTLTQSKPLRVMSNAAKAEELDRLNKIKIALDATGVTSRDSEEFKAFKNGLNTAIEKMKNTRTINGRDKIIEELSDCATGYYMAKIDQPMNSKREKRFRLAAAVRNLTYGRYTDPKELLIEEIAGKIVRTGLIGDRAKISNPIEFFAMTNVLKGNMMVDDEVTRQQQAAFNKMVKGKDLNQLRKLFNSSPESLLKKAGMLKETGDLKTYQIPRKEEVNKNKPRPKSL